MATFGIIVILSLLHVIYAVDEGVNHKRLLLDDNEPALDIGEELRQLRAQLRDFQNTTASLRNDVQTLKDENTRLHWQQQILGSNFQSTTASLKNDVQTLKDENTRLHSQQQILGNNGGAVYVRWGRNVCSTTADFVYKGFAAGKHWQQSGDGTDTLCLPTDPTWSRYVDGLQNWGAFIYGAEYEIDDGKQIFPNGAHDENMPCVVCQSKKPAVIMVPGRNNCYGNWTEEYQGYLMAAQYTTNSHNHICVDQDPEFVQGGNGNDNQHVLYLVESVCGALPCPPYVQGRELACVVCSK